MKKNKLNASNDINNQGLVGQMNKMKRTISLRNYVKDTYGIQKFDDIKMSILSISKNYLKRELVLIKVLRTLNVI